MPAYIRPIQHTRDFSLKPPDGLRYGNFDSIVHLPPINSGSQKIGPHSLAVLNNQQICRTVSEWFEIWRPWQQRTLLCGIVDRCSTRQLDMLSTTFEPISHRDYATALHHTYPAAAFKKLKEEVKKQTRKQRGRKKALPRIRNDSEFVETFSNQGDGSHVDAMTIYTADMTSRDVSPETVIFKVPTFIPEDSKENLDEVQPKIKLRKKSKADKTETKTEILKGSNKDIASHLPKIGEGGESLLKYNANSVKKKKKKSKQVNKEDEVQDSSERNLKTGVETVNVTGDFHGVLKKSLIEDSVETFANTLAEDILDSALDHLADQKAQNKANEKHHHHEHVSEEIEMSPEIETEEQLIDDHNQNVPIVAAAENAESANEMHKDKTNQEPDLFHESDLQQTNLLLQDVKIKKTLPAAVLSQLSRPSGEPSQKGQLIKTAPNWERMSPVPQVMGEEKYESADHGRNGSELSKTLTEVNRVRYSLFGANTISTPDFFVKSHLYGFGPVRREVRRKGPLSRSLVPQNVPVAVSRFYKSVKWWPEEPHAGMIFLKPTKTELMDNFRDQILQIWNWMTQWEDYEKIVLLKDVVKVCGPDQLGYLNNYIRNRLQDTRDINRMPDKLLLYIFSYLPAESIIRASQVCRRWRFLCASDDLWMVKCHELGALEGIQNLEGMILKASRHKLGIDWRLAFEELRRITMMMKIELDKAKKIKMVKILEKKEGKTETLAKQDTEVEQPVRKFAFANEVEYQSPDFSMTSDNIDRLLRQILFSPEGLHREPSENLSDKEPRMVELEVKVKIVGELGQQSSKTNQGTLKPDIDSKSDLSDDDLAGLDDEYKFLPALIIPEPQEPQETKKQKQKKSLKTVSIHGPTKVKPVTDGVEGKQRADTGVIAPRPLHSQREETEDDQDNVALDIRPQLQQAQDILGKLVPTMSLEWKEESVQKQYNHATAVVGYVKNIKRARKLQGHMSGIMCIQFDKRRLISAGLDRVIRIWDIRSGRSIHKFHGHKGGIRCMFLYDNTLYTGSWDTTVMVWDLKTLTRKCVLIEHMGSVSCLHISNDYIISGSHDTTVRVWYRSTYYCLNVLHGHKGPITSLAFDGQFVVTGSMDMTLRMTNIQSGHCVHVFKGIQKQVLTLVIKGSLIISGDILGHVYFWNKSTGDCEAAISAHEEAIHKVTYLGGRFFTASGDTTIKEWDLVTMTCIRHLQGHKGPVRDIKVSENRIVTCSDDGSIRIWDMYDPREKVKSIENV